MNEKIQRKTKIQFLKENQDLKSLQKPKEIQQSGKTQNP